MAYKRKITVRYMKKRARKAYKKPTLKKQLLRLHETKEVAYQHVEQMTQQTHFQFSPTQIIVPGNTGTTRVGDDVYLQSLVMSGWFATETAADACHKFRCTVFWSREEQAAATFLPNLIVGTALYHAGTFNQNVNGITSSSAVTVLADFVIDAALAVNGAREYKSFNVVVPLNQNFKYKAVGSAYGKTKNLYVSMTSFREAAAPGANSGVFTFSSILKFKDP